MIILAPVVTMAQDEEKPTFPLETIYAERKPWGVRKILRNFRFSVSTGYGKTFYSHKLDGYGIIQPKNGPPLVFLNTTPATVYSNWVTKIVQDSSNTAPVDPFTVKSDTAKLGFKGRPWSIPLNATIHYEFLERYRLGGGFSYEYMNIGPLHSRTFKDKIHDFQATPRGGFMMRYYGMAGISFYRIDKFLFTGDAQVGGYKPSKKQFDLSQMKRGMYVNVGVTIEHEFSEYLKAFVRPSFEFKSYTLNMPEQAIPHYMNALYVNIGLTYSIPELPRCFHKDCMAQMNHVHGDREYRSRVHKIYKKQNPLYGENYPKLLKYKWRNKRKLNPY